MKILIFFSKKTNYYAFYKVSIIFDFLNIQMGNNNDEPYIILLR